MDRRSLLLVLTLAPTLGVPGTSPVAAAPPPMPDPPAGAYRLGTGDELKIAVFGLDAASGTYVIDDSGSISVPLAGQVAVAGKTLAEVEAALNKALLDRQILKVPQASVQIARYRPFYILGEVQRPGQYPYAPGMTVLNAVSVAGGYTFRANRKRATITRPGENGPIEGTAKPESRIAPGDTIQVPEAWF